MGKKIRERSSAEQIIYEAVIGRLLAGEKAQALANEFGLSPEKLRVWKWRATEEQRRTAQHPSTQPDTLLNDVPQLVTAMSEGCNDAALARYDNVIRAESLRSALLEQGSHAVMLLTELRAFVGRGVKASSSALTSLLEGLAEDCARNVTTIVQDGEVLEVPMTPVDKQRCASALKAATETFVKLHVIPYGEISTSPLQLAETATGNAQHLHLHSHGGRVTEPARVKRDIMTVTDVTPSAASTELDESQQSLLDSV